MFSREGKTNINDIFIHMLTKYGVPQYIKCKKTKTVGFRYKIENIDYVFACDTNDKHRGTDPFLLKFQKMFNYLIVFIEFVGICRKCRLGRYFASELPSASGRARSESVEGSQSKIKLLVCLRMPSNWVSMAAGATAV